MIVGRHSVAALRRRVYAEQLLIRADRVRGIELLSAALRLDAGKNEWA